MSSINPRVPVTKGYRVERDTKHVDTCLPGNMKKPEPDLARKRAATIYFG